MSAELTIAPLVAVLLALIPLNAEGAVPLKPCPESPNCVCSTAPEGDAHAITPLPLPPEVDALAVLRELMAALPRTAEVSATQTAIHFTVTTAFFRFVDDVEFEIDAEGGVVHVRSASRLGYSDLGVNRARIEALRTAWLAATSQ